MIDGYVNLTKGFFFPNQLIFNNTKKDPKWIRIYQKLEGKKNRRNSSFTTILQSRAELGFYEWVGDGGDYNKYKIESYKKYEEFGEQKIFLL